MTRIDRGLAARLGRETVAILEAGAYEGPEGSVDLGDALVAARAGTRSYPPHEAIAPPPSPGHATHYEVCNETTLLAVQRLPGEGYEPAALNFASAYHPGGGFLGGSRAQEESLARSSGLYACIEGHPMYAHNQAHRNPRYSDWLLYSPGVPVFRTDDGALLARPHRCAFITAPAVNARALLAREPAAGEEIQQIMARRIDRVLSVAALHEHSALVLGAWGCGAFGNDPAQMAELFAEALHGPHAGRWAHVVFAVVDWTDDRRILGPFARAFT